LLFTIGIRAVGQDKQEQKKIRRLLKTLGSDLCLLKRKDAANYEFFAKYGDIPSGKIGAVYSRADFQLKELQKNFPYARKKYWRKTKRIIKKLKTT